jgi:hypothetical protein
MHVPVCLAPRRVGMAPSVDEEAGTERLRGCDATVPLPRPLQLAVRSTETATTMPRLARMRRKVSAVRSRSNLNRVHRSR